MKFKTQYRAGMALCSALSLTIILAPLTSVGEEFKKSHIDAAKKVITVTESTKQLDDILPDAAIQLATRLIQNRPDIEAQITDIANHSAIELAPRRGDLENEVAKIYARTFEEAELNAYAEFFSTPAGKKFLKELPIVVREVGKAAKVWANGINRDISIKAAEKLKAAGLQ